MKIIDVEQGTPAQEASMSASEETLVEAICPKPGIYPDVPSRDYHQWRAGSASLFETAWGKSWAHAVQPRDDESRALVVGEALHTAVLQPHLFDKAFVAAPTFDRRTKAGKDGYAQFCNDHSDAQILAHDEMESIRCMQDAVRSHAYASSLLEAATDIELSFVWDAPIDPETIGSDGAASVRCKGRADALTNYGAVIDLKTTRDASLAEFESSIWNWGYFIQAAMYLDGLAANGRTLERFAFIAVEKTPPYAVAVYQLDAKVIEAGRWAYRQKLVEYRNCCQHNIWPGYPKVQTASMPGWAWMRLKDLGFTY